MAKKLKLGVFDVIVCVFLLIMAIIFIYPLWHVLVAAFSDPLEYAKNPLMVFPKSISMYNFKQLITSKNIWNGYANTLLYASVGTVISVSLTITMAYGLSMKELPYKKFLGFVITLTLFFSGGIIPTYLMVQSYGLIDTIWGVLLPGAVWTYNIMITRTYLSQQIPQDLVEAAEVDGAGPFKSFLLVIIPLCKPIIAVNGLYYASGYWNNWYDAMLYLNDGKKYPLQLLLRQLLIVTNDSFAVTELGQNTNRLTVMTYNYAIIVISILPLLVIFPFVQKYFTKGIMIGAIKG